MVLDTAPSGVPALQLKFFFLSLQLSLPLSLSLSLNDAQWRFLQPWKWQLTGIGYNTAAQARGAHCPRNGLWTRSYAARRTTPQSATLGLRRIIIHVPNYMDQKRQTRRNTGL